MTVLDRTPVADDAGRVTDERQKRPDPEVPEGPAGGRSPRSKSWTSSPPMTRRELVAVAGARWGIEPGPGGTRTPHHA